MFIKRSVITLDKDARVYVYGSRVNDFLNGGDIDLLIISEKLDSFTDKNKIKWKIIEKIGEQKIDIIITPSTENSPFTKKIIENAIEI